MAEKSYSISDFNVSTTWTYSCNEVNEVGTTQYSCSNLSSKSADKTVTIEDKSILPFINSIVLTWNYSTKLTNGNSNMPTTSGYSAGSYSYIKAYTVDSSGERKYSGQVATSKGKMTIPISYLMDDKIYLRFTYDPDPNPDYWDVNTERGSWSTSYTTTGSAYWENIKLTIDYTPYAKLSIPSITAPTTSTSPYKILPNNNSVTLSWQESKSTGSNTVSAYHIYKDNAFLANAGISTSYEIETLPEQGSASSYYVVAISTGDEAYNSLPSSSITIQRYGVPVPIVGKLYTSYNSAQESTIYIGKKNKPKVYVTWSGGTAGTYDDGEVTVTFNGTKVTSGSEVTNAEGNNYKLIAKTASGQTTECTLAISYIKAPGEIKFVSNPSGTIGTNQTYSWDAPSKVGNASLYYIIELAGEPSKSLGEQKSTSYELDIKNLGLSRGSSYQITVQSKAIATWGGHTLGTSVYSNSFTYAAEINSINATILGETGNDTYAWKKFTIKVLNASSYKDLTIKATIGSQTIELYNDEANKQDQYTHNISNIEEGSEITYTISANDIYTQTTSTTLTRYRFKPPTVLINNITQDSTPDSDYNVIISVNPTFQFSSGSEGAIGRYKIEAQYGKDKYLVLDNHSCNDIDTSKFTMNFSNDSYKNNMPDLYNILTTGKIANPTINFIVTVWDENFGPEACSYDSQEKNVDFSMKPSILKFEINNADKIISSNENINIVFKTDFKDCSGGEGTANLSYILKRNNYTISSGFCSPQEEISINDVCGEISSESVSYSYSIEVTQNYKDLTSSINNTLEDGFPVYKHTKPTVNVRSIEWEDNNVIVNGTITINGSSKIDNIKNLSITINIDEENYTVVKDNVNSTSKIILEDLLFNEQRITADTNTNHTINIKAISTSLNGGQKTIEVGSFVLRALGIPFAIRKYGIGTNISPTFKPEKTEAALQIVGNSEAEIIASFASGRTNPEKISLELDCGNKAYLTLVKGTDPYFTIVFPE